MAVTRDYTPDNFLGGTAPVQGSAQAPQVAGGGEGGGNALLQGSVSRTSGTFGRSATVKAGEDIRPALESLKSAGGGTLILLAGVHRPDYDIVGASKINIVGEGVDQTIIDFGGENYSFIFKGISGNYLDSFSISNLTILNSGADAGLEIDYSDSFSVASIKIQDCSSDGIYVKHSNNFSFFSTESVSNDRDGLLVESDNFSNQVTNFTINNSQFNNNSGHGIKFYGVYVFDYTVIRCVCSDNSSDGINITENLNFGGNSGGQISYCTCNDNGGDGIRNYNDASSFVSNNCISNSGAGIRLVNANKCSVVGNISLSNNITSDDGNINIAANQTTVTGNSVSVNSSQDPLFSINPGNTNTNFIFGNIGESSINIKKVISAINASGSTLAFGSVVIRKDTTSGYEFTTTTTQGDDLVLGVIAFFATGTILDGKSGYIIQEGKTASLKVNGTTDIAVGDFLCTFTTAGISAKAGTGDMAFAIALEAYTANNSSGVIDALLISPRKI